MNSVIVSLSLWRRSLETKFHFQDLNYTFLYFLSCGSFNKAMTEWVVFLSSIATSYNLLA